MKKNKKKTKFILILLVLAISIGFAALATTLKINGSSKISKNLWHIYWENKSVNQEGVSQTGPTLTTEEDDDDLTVATWNVTLNLPGDFYEFTINAVNSGTLDAMISEAGVVTNHEANNINTPSSLPSYISYTVTYEDGTAIAPYHLLAKKNGNTPTKEAYKVRVEFTDDITPEQMNAIPEGGYRYTFTTQVQYVQADSNAIDLHPGENWDTYYYVPFNGEGYDGGQETTSTFSNSWAFWGQENSTAKQLCGRLPQGVVCFESQQWDETNIASIRNQIESEEVQCSESDNELRCGFSSTDDVDGLYIYFIDENVVSFMDAKYSDGSYYCNLDGENGISCN